jgi:hypothetical protein
MVIDVPFDFYVGETAHSKGTYELVRLEGQPVLFLRDNSGGREVQMWSVAPSVPKAWSDRSSVKFLKYDSDHTFLKEIRYAPLRQAWSTPSCRKEREHVTSRVVTAQSMPQEVILFAGAQ